MAVEEEMSSRYRPQGGGDYDRSLRLEPGLESADVTGFGLHVT
ncbi:hypothetical protein [Nocardia sp. NPDC050175]